VPVETTSPVFRKPDFEKRFETDNEKLFVSMIDSRGVQNLNQSSRQHLISLAGQNEKDTSAL
jgi:hypothetical protein